MLGEVYHRTDPHLEMDAPIDEPDETARIPLRVIHTPALPGNDESNTKVVPKP